MKKEKAKSRTALPVIEEKILGLSSEAAEKMKGALERHSALGVRVSAKQNENGSISFSLDLEDSAYPNDLVVEEKGVKLFLDPSTAKLSQGVEIRYVETERGSGFAFVSPYGCGPG